MIILQKNLLSSRFRTQISQTSERSGQRLGVLIRTTRKKITLKFNLLTLLPGWILVFMAMRELFGFTSMVVMVAE